MSNSTNNPLGYNAESLDVSPQFQAYSGVEIVVDDETSYFAGNRTGRVLQVQNPWGNQTQANDLLATLTNAGIQYQPYKASKALLNPAAELGDAVTINGIYGGIYKIARDHNALMDADIEAPEDEELDHEYPYEPEADRVFKREIAENKAQILINSNSITAEVTRATAAEGSLSSRITQTANSITSEVTARQNADNNLSSKITQNANSITSEVTARKNADTTLTTRIKQAEDSITSEVTRATKAEGTLQSKITQNADSIAAKVSQRGGSNSSFGWELLSNGFTLYSGSKAVFKCTSSGIEVNGKVTATSGYIGNGANGFTITSSAIYNGMTTRDDNTHNGVYIGTNGIGVGKGNFRVGSDGNVSIGWGNFTVSTSGNVKANNMTLTGRLTIGGTAITAEALRSGAQSAYNNSGTWSTGAGYGYNYNDATKNGTSNYPSYFTCGRLIATSLILGGKHCSFSAITINGVTYNLLKGI